MNLDEAKKFVETEFECEYGESEFDYWVNETDGRIEVFCHGCRRDIYVPYEKTPTKLKETP